MVAKQTAYARLTDYYKEFIQQRSADFTALDYEYLQIEQVLAWLTGQIDHQHSLNLLDLMERLSPYLDGRSLNNIILRYFEPCLKAAQRIGQNPARIYLSAYRANWSLGHWDVAYLQVLQAVQESSQSNPRDYANALQSLGSLQLNQGNYREALNTFADAKRIFRELDDATGEVSIKAEEAAYYLNRADYRTAHTLYSEIMDFELARESQVSDHTLLMMGVVSRRLKNLTTAIDYFNQLFQRAQANKLKGAYATAAHHIAWTYLDLGQLIQAKEFGEFAQTTYDEVQDLRGASDANEQLGLIAMAMRQYEESHLLLERSASVRNQIGNQQGYASSLRRLAKLSFIQARFGWGIRYLTQSLFIYYKIGMLPVSRFYKIVFDTFSQRISS